MIEAFIIIFLVFMFIISGMLVLKRSANKFKLPKNIKAQPYSDDDEDKNDSQSK